MLVMQQTMQLNLHNQKHLGMNANNEVSKEEKK